MGLGPYGQCEPSVLDGNASIDELPVAFCCVVLATDVIDDRAGALLGNYRRHDEPAEAVRGDVDIPEALLQVCSDPVPHPLVREGP